MTQRRCAEVWITRHNSSLISASVFKTGFQNHSVFFYLSIITFALTGVTSELRWHLSNMIYLNNIFTKYFFPNIEIKKGHVVPAFSWRSVTRRMIFSGSNKRRFPPSITKKHFIILPISNCHRRLLWVTTLRRSIPCVTGIEVNTLDDMVM